MPFLPVRGVRWVDDEPQPGVVEVEFSDVDGIAHRVQGKWVDFAEDWPSRSEVPGGLTAECVVTGAVQADGSVEIAFDLPAVDEDARFRVAADQLR